MKATTCEGREDQMVLLAGDDLPAEEADEARRHARTCASCRAVLNDIGDSMHWASRVGRVTLDDGDRRRLRQHIVDAIPWSRRRGAGAGMPLGLAIAAMVAVLVLPARRTPHSNGVLSHSDDSSAAQPPEAIVDEGTVPANDDDDIVPWGSDEESESTTLPGTLRIDLLTKDPKIRIVWLARR